MGTLAIPFINWTDELSERALIVMLYAYFCPVSFICCLFDSEQAVGKDVEGSGLAQF
jgi:hypothetical protein